MSHTDLAQASGLSRSRISELSRKTSWKGVPIDVVERFSKACGVDLTNPGPTIEYLRKSKMIHTRNCSANQKKFFAALFASKIRKS